MSTVSVPTPRSGVRTRRFRRLARLGFAVNGVVHLLIGSSSGRPALGDVSVALAELGIDIRSLGAADRQSSGLFVVDAVDADGGDLVVKVFGRDAHDTQLTTSAWRALW